MHKLITLIILSTLFLSGCKTSTEPVPPEKKPPGYQEDVPWASLADSPWPIYHHDTQNTGRSKFAGPKLLEIYWSTPIKYNQTSAVLISDLIITAPTNTPKGLIALSKSGALQWQYIIDSSYSEIQTTPFADKNGNIYCASGLNGIIISVTSEGKLRWKFDNHNSIFNASLGIGIGGKIYFIDGSNSLVELSENGHELKRIRNADFNNSANISITFSPDGKTIYVPGISASVYSIDVGNFQIKWKFGSSKLDYGPLVDNKGNVYFNGIDSLGNYSFFSINNQGKVNWRYTHNNEELYKYSLNPTMDNLGNTYFAYDTLYSIDYSGKLNWKTNLDGFCASPLISDKDNNVYLNTSNYITGVLLKVGADGQISAQLTFTDNDIFGYAPVIDQNGVLYMPTWRGDNFYAIK